MPELFEVVNSRTIDLLNNIRINMGRAGMNATNETQHSLRYEIDQDGPNLKVRVYGRPYFMTVQTGRKPTPEKKPSREMISRLMRWVDARGMDESAVWAIATNIQKKGTQLWRDGGRTDIVDPAVDEYVNELSKDILDGIADEFMIKLKDGFSS